MITISNTDIDISNKDIDISYTEIDREGLRSVLHQLDQKIIYPHYDFKHLTEKYFEIGMKLDDFLIQLVKYCRYPVSTSHIRFRQIKLYALYNRYSSFNRHRTGKITVAR